MAAHQRACLGRMVGGMDEYDYDTGSQTGGQRGVGKRVHEYQDSQHAQGGQTCLDQVAVGVLRELGVYDPDSGW